MPGRDDAVPPQAPLIARSADPELRRLGKELRGRSEDVVEEIRRLTQAAGKDLDDAVRSSFERVGAMATISVAQWRAAGLRPASTPDAKHGRSSGSSPRTGRRPCTR